MWAFAKLRYYEDGGAAVFDRARAPCPALLRDVSARDMSNLLYACALVNHTHGIGQVLDLMLPHLQLGQCNGQDLANNCWSLAVLGLSSHPAMEALMWEANGHQQHGYYTQDGLCQLWQAHLELQDLSLAHLGLSGQLQVAALTAWRGGGAEQAESSLQLQVATAVRELEPSSRVEMEGTTRCGMFTVDMLMTLPGQTLPLAVEVDGPSHFMHSLATATTATRSCATGSWGVCICAACPAWCWCNEWDYKSHSVHLELLRVKLAQVVRGWGHPLGSLYCPPVACC